MDSELRIPFGTSLRVFADTSALMEPGAAASFDSLVSDLRGHGLKVIVPQRVLDELQKLRVGKPVLAAAALQLLDRLRNQSVLDIRGEEDDGYVDNLFQAVFVRFRLKYDLLLITQDGFLAQDVLSLNGSNAV